MKEKICTFSHWIIVLVGVPAGLYLGQTFLITFIIGIILSMVLSPVMDWLMDKGLPKGWAVAASTLLLLLFFSFIFGLLFYQVNLLVEDWPRIKEKSTGLFDQAQSYIAVRTGLTPEQQTQKAQQIANRLSSSLAAFFGTFTSTVTNFLLVFVYVVLMLSHRHRFERFLLKTVKTSDKKQVGDTIHKVRKSASSYVWGMLKVISALAAFYSIGFWLGGIKYSILLAILAAMFSFLPYVGNVIGGGTAALLAVVSGEPSGFFVVLGVMTVAQLLENYFLSPMIVGDEVELNPFFSIVSVILFGALWGIGGAIVAIPLAAIVHIVLKFSPDTLPLAELMENSKDSEK